MVLCFFVFCAVTATGSCSFLPSVGLWQTSMEVTESFSFIVMKFRLKIEFVSCFVHCIHTNEPGLAKIFAFHWICELEICGRPAALGKYHWWWGGQPNDPGLGGGKRLLGYVGELTMTKVILLLSMLSIHYEMRTIPAYPPYILLVFLKIDADKVTTPQTYFEVNHLLLYMILSELSVILLLPLILLLLFEPDAAVVIAFSIKSRSALPTSNFFVKCQTALRVSSGFSFNDGNQV